MHLFIIPFGDPDVIIFTLKRYSNLTYLELGVAEVREHDLVRGFAAVLYEGQQAEQLAACRRVHIGRVVQVPSPYLLNAN